MSEPTLTGMEIRVLCLIAEGLTEWDIRKALCLSATNLHHYCNLLYIKTGCRNWQQLTRYAIAQGYVSPTWQLPYRQASWRTAAILPSEAQAPASPAITIVLIDKRPLMRAGWRSVLAALSLRVVGEASDEETGLSLCRVLLPRVVVLGILVADRTTAVARIKDVCPDTSLVVIHETFVRTARPRFTLAEGAIYLAETADVHELTDVVLSGYHQQRADGSADQ
jgi:DNA-binding NarL/FixJ family response regulator